MLINDIYKWKPGGTYFIPISNSSPIIHDLSGKYKFMAPDYMGAPFALRERKFLAAKDGIAYSCAHAFYAGMMKDRAPALDILNSESVRVARIKAEFYRKRKDWKAYAAGLMEDIYYERFRQHFSDKRLLGLTKDSPILAYINGDTYWGVKKEENVYVGYNLIGKALMRYRSWLINLK